MANQRICSYNKDHLRDITEEIRKDSERFKMPVKTVSLSSYMTGYSSRHSAIAVFEEEQEIVDCTEIKY